MRPMRCLVTPMLALVVCGAAQAQNPPNITAGELALLPAFCSDTIDMPKFGTTPGANYWLARVGEGFRAMHHYCWARINQRRLSIAVVDNASRNRSLGYMIDDLNYVINHSPPGFVLLPEVYSARAEFQLLRGEPSLAFLSIDTAWKLKPSYGPPYRLWGDYLASIGKKAEARDVVKTGLEYNPSDPDLRSRYLALGGDLSRLQPKVAAAADGPEAAASAPMTADAVPSAEAAAASSTSSASASASASASSSSSAAAAAAAAAPR
jgi:hypothetical protein